MAAAEEVCCANCDCTKNVMKRCAGCLQAFYCSQECQRNHWPSHQAECARTPVLHPNATKCLPVEIQGSCKIKMDSDKKIMTHLNDVPASTNSYVSIETEGQHMNKPSNCHSHYNEEKMLVARNEGISYNTLELGKLSTSPPKSDVGDLKQGMDCSLAAEELEVTAGFCKDIKTKPTRSSSCSEGGNITVNPSVTIFIKHNKIKHTLGIRSLPNNGKLVMQLVSDLLHIPVPKLKLIHKGKMVTQENIECFISENALFQAFGEVAETEDDLEKSDIDLIMKQVDVERNAAIRALRKAGTVVDAIIDLGNK